VTAIVPAAESSADAHDCEWRTAVSELQKSNALLSAEVANLKRMFEKRSEKSKKLTPVSKPKVSAEETQATRQNNAAERTESLPTTDVAIKVDPADKHCAKCGDRKFVQVGEGKTSETYEYIPGILRRVVHHRETCKCRCGATIVTAPAPARWSDKTKYAASVVSYLVVQKTACSMPFYRLEQTLCDQGLRLSRSTMNDLFYRAAEALSPLRAVLEKAIRSALIVQIDETSFNMTAKKGKKSYMWGFLTATLALYRFSEKRAGNIPVEVLGDSTGYFVADDYSGYHALAALGGRIRCGCMAHARRGFSEALPLPQAEAAIALIQEIYAAEHAAAGALGSDKHLALRTSRAKPAFVSLIKLCRTIRDEHGPKSIIGKAARYTLSNLSTLKQFLRNALLPSDNNRVENLLRIIALGRKNYLFAQSKEAAEGLALLYSLTACCKMSGVNPMLYFEDVLNRIGDEKKSALRDLLPDKWTPKSLARA
jgi:transposase